MDGVPYLGKKNRTEFSRAQLEAFARAAERLGTTPDIVEEFFTGFCYTSAKLQRRNMQYVDVGQKGRPAQVSVSIPMFGHLRYHKSIVKGEGTDYCWIRRRQYIARKKIRKAEWRNKILKSENNNGDTTGKEN